MSKGLEYDQPQMAFMERAKAHPESESDHIPGATKKVDRTMIAAMAMQGLLNATSVERFSLRIKPESIAEAAVEYADALIDELNKTEQ